jgi:small-conductance mechanosensitive channel
MTFFADSPLNSPTIKTTRATVHYMANHATGPEFLRFYIYLALGILATLLVLRLTSWVVRKSLRQSPPEVVDKVTSAVRIPLSLLVFSYFLLVGFDAITDMPHELWMHVHENLYPIFTGLLVLVCAFRLVDLIAHLLRQRWQSETVQLDERWADLIGLVGKAIVSIGAGIFIIEKIDPSFNIIPILTGLSFIGAAVALASQNTIANAIGSLEIMADRLFKEGDRISFGEYDGFVTRMGLRSITLTALTGEKINLPNKDLVDKQIRNYTRGKFVSSSLVVGILYSHSRAEIEKALELMQAVARSHARVESCGANLRRFADSAVELQLWFLADFKNGGEYGQIMSEIHLALKEAFDQAGIVFAFPTQTVHLKREG